MLLLDNISSYMQNVYNIYKISENTVYLIILTHVVVTELLHLHLSLYHLLLHNYIEYYKPCVTYQY